jgi:hypothetical protein
MFAVVWKLNGSVSRCPVPLKIDHLNIGAIQYSNPVVMKFDNHCALNDQIGNN